MDLEKHIKTVLGQVLVIQLATVRDGQPWCCNVRVYTDDDIHIYWVSHPDVRHSQEIADDPHVGAAAALKLAEPLLGVQIEGTAAVVTEQAVIDRVMGFYGERHGNDPAWINQVASGKSALKLYCLTPARIAIFDQMAFPDDPQQTWQPNKKSA
jgi:uncharacterized protein YhbP (UPF0306 family)